MLRTIHLHGQLGKRFGKRFELAVNTPAEAVRALMFQLPGFGEYVRHRNYVVSDDDGGRMGADEINMQLGRQPAIHITPAGMLSGVVEVVLGVTLLLAAAASVAVLAAPKAPTASSREEGTKTASFIFDGPTNVTEQGHPVPLIYGRMRVGSIVASSGIATTDVNQAGVSANPNDPLGGGDYAGYVGSTPGIKNSPAGDEWVQLAKGGKGGSGTTRAAQEDPNTLQSQATAKVLDVIGEGEIVGLVNGLQSVFFDDTPLQNADGTYNFSGVTVEQRYGLPDQDFIPGFSATENTRGIDTPVTVKFGPVTRTVDDDNATVARVTIRIPQLYRQDTTNGDLKATTVSVKIGVQADNGGFTDVATMTFTDRSNGPYQRSMDVRLPAGGERDIRVTRLTPDSEATTLVNDTVFDLLTEVVEAKLTYPDTALIGLTVDARQFGSNIPARSYDVKGLILEVPSNYDPVARTYAGLWDGTFKRAWTDNPAWVLRDIIVHRRYGLGQRVPAEAVDIWGLYAIAQHCDGMVPDGFGGMEPRYTINCCINNAAQAYDVIASIASNFRGLVYWGSGTVMATQDRPEDPSVLVTPSNVVDGRISYGRVTPVERRRSVAVVYWNDPEDGFRLTPEIVEDDELVRRFGRRGESEQDAVTAYGVTRRGQAHRAARWLLEDESPASNATASYAVGDDHSFVEPGRVASIADPKYTKSRRGGRVRSANIDTLQIDAAYSFAAGQNYWMRVMLPNGTVSVRPIIQTTGKTDQITLGGDSWQTPPMAGAVWTIETDVVVNRQWRVRRLTTDEAPYEVEAVAHDPTKWDRVELNRDISSPNFLDLPTGALQPPGNIEVFEFLQQDGNASIPCAQVSWQRSDDPRVTFYQAQSKEPGGSYSALADSVDLTRTIRNVVPGEWSFRVRALDSLGRKTAWIEKTVTLDGQVDFLPSVLGLSVQTNDDALQAMLVWLKPRDTRPLRFEILYDGNGVLANAITLGVVDTQEYPVSQPGTYWVRTRFIDAYSANPPSVLVSVADLPAVEWEKVKDRPQSLEDLDPVAQQDIYELLAGGSGGGDGSGAAASAAAAAASARAAQDAEANAKAARDAAQDAFTAADTARDAAEQASRDAAQSSFNAGGYATTASGQATIATQKADDAGRYASNASASALTAETEAGKAGVYASDAATSESNAAGSASAAATSQTVSARAANESAAAALLQGRSPGARLEAWTANEFDRMPASTNLAALGYQTVNGQLRLSNVHIEPIKAMKLDRTKRYLGSATFRPVETTGPFSGGYLVFVAYYRADDSYITNGAVSHIPDDTIPDNAASRTISRVIQPAEYPADAEYIRFCFRGPAGKVTELNLLYGEDVEASQQSIDYASASATSASSAAASNTTAGQFAAAAETSKIAAQTAQSAAEVARSDAATSATNAAGSASTASTSARLAAASANFRGITPNGDFATADLWRGENMTWAASVADASGVWRSPEGQHGGLYGPRMEVNGTLVYRPRVRFASRGYGLLHYVGFQCHAPDGRHTGNIYGTGLSGHQQNFDWIEREWEVAGFADYGSQPVYIGNASAWPAGTSYAFPMFLANYPDAGGPFPGIVDVDYYYVEEFTTAAAARQSAAASATSASVASTKAGEAGSSASAAQSARLAAEAANGTAQGFASVAESKAALADSSASAAAVSASQSASFRDTAGGYASAADGYRASAETAASNASSSASTASASAATASSAAVISAQVSSSLSNRGSTFSEWPDTDPIPAYWSGWGDQTAVRVAGLVGRYGFRQTADHAGDRGLTTLPSYDPGLQGLRRGLYVIEADITLESGSLIGSGVLFRGLNSSGGVVYDNYLNFQNQPLPGGVSGEVIGRGFAGNRYRFAVPGTIPAGVESVQIYLMTQWVGFSSAPENKTLTWHRCGIRPATEAEIKSGQIDNISASVTTLQGAVAVIDGRSQAFLRNTAQAGGAVARLELVAISGPNTEYSQAELVADAVYLGPYRTLEVVNGVVRVNGKLTAANVEATSLSAITSEIGTLTSVTNGYTTIRDGKGTRIYRPNGRLALRTGPP